jgi:hypothetical protein
MMATFTILVTASRAWDRPDVVEGTLLILAASAWDSGYGHVVVRHGACPHGGDMQADAWARSQRYAGLPVRADRWPADWTTYGKRAGYIRNVGMVQAEPTADVCVAFIRDLSKGASNCAELAERAGIPVQVIDYDDIADAAEVSR